MFLTSALRRALTIGGVSVLAVVGLIGWTHRSVTPPAPAVSASQLGNPEPVAIPNEAPANAYGETPVPTGAGSYAAPPPEYPNGTYAAPPAPPARAAVRTPYRRVYYARRHRRRYVVVTRRRRFRRSAEIVAGSAGVGAAVGAIAGGGPGAGIGALVGGTGGFIYDRATHKKKRVVVVER